MSESLKNADEISFFYRNTAFNGRGEAAYQIQGGPKNGTVFWYTLTSSNINRFSKLFHCQNQEKMYNNTITKDPTTPHVCRYTTL